MKPVAPLLVRSTILAAALAAHLPLAHAGRYTYHGDLLDGDVPAEGQFDLRVRALASPQSSKSLAPATELPDVTVAEGRFSVEVDLPDSDLATMWVEVAVRPKGSGDFEVLGAPRPVSKANSTCPGAWALDGNTGVPAGSFLGLADAASAAPLEFRARNLIVARFTPAGTPTDYGDAARVSLGSSGNFAGAFGATVGGGGATRNGSGAACTDCGNRATAIFATVSGGRGNLASSGSSSIGGGSGNLASGAWSTVAGGISNVASGGDGPTVGGGEYNQASGFTSTVGGGAANRAPGGFTTIAGGASNEATNQHASVGGGNSNKATGISSHVGGGKTNVASGESSQVGAGEFNEASGIYSTVAGGFQNSASDFGASVGGGFQNLATHIGATVAGGAQNRATGSHSFAAGISSCAGGDRSVALGQSAFVRPGNEVDDFNCGDATTSGDVDGDEGTFVFADDGDAPFRSSGPNQFNIRARGGVGINAAPANGSIEMTIQADADDGDFANLWLKQKSANANGVMLSVGDGAGVNNASFYVDHFSGSAQARRMELLGTGAVVIRSNITQANTGVTMAANAGSWSSLSDRRLKTAIELVDAGAILDRLVATPISTWSYIAQGEGVRHIGPMAQDFAAAFGLGENDTTISTIDADGVALAAIQGLNRKLEIENAGLRDALDQLAQRLARLEADAERTR